MNDAQEIADDEDFFEGDDDSEDYDESDSDERMLRLAPRRGWMPAHRPTMYGSGAAGDDPRSEDPSLRGVRGGLISTRQGTAVFRMPTAVATARGVRTLARRNSVSQAMLEDHERSLRAARSAERRQNFYSTVGIGVQHARDIANEARQTFGARAGAPATPYLASLDYALSTAQTAAAVAAVPPSRRSWALSSLPFTAGLVAAGAREILRAPAGFGARRKPWPHLLALVAPAVIGGIATVAVRPAPRRRRSY
jgi:hypothetical protein